MESRGVMLATASTTATKTSGPLASRARALGLSLLALTLAGGLWFGLPELSVQARLSFIIFGLAVLGWIGTDIDETYIALAAAMVLSVLGGNAPDEFFETLGDPMIWLLLASFVLAAALTRSGLSHRLTRAVASRVASVHQLFYALAAVLFVTAFVIPSTTGRAALMVPVFSALSQGIANKRISRALALLFPTVILLSAVASLIGAGAHLVTADMVWRLGGERLGFGRWLLLGGPFALLSCCVSTWVILHLFLDRPERQLRLTPAQLAAPGAPPSLSASGPLSSKEWYVLGLVLVVVLGWATEALHGLNSTVIAILGALAATAPRLGSISFKDGLKGVEWPLLLFMAATIELGEGLTESGGAEWLVRQLFQGLQGSMVTSALFVTAAVALVSLLAHVLITSRTARSSVLVPLVVLLGLSLGYNPTLLAFLSTAAAGFCLTLPVSAKSVAMFSQLDGTTYGPRDLLRLSSVLLPLHFGLLLLFAFVVWPGMGLPLTRDSMPPPALQWYQGARHSAPGAPDMGLP